MSKPIDIYEPSLRIHVSFLHMLADDCERMGSYERAVALRALTHTPETFEDFNTECTLALAAIDTELERERA